MKKLTSIIKTLAAITAISAPLSANSGTVMVRPGNSTTGIETILTGDFNERFNYFGRGTINISYDNTASDFFFADLTFNMGKGFGGVVELQAASSTGFVPRAGISYFLQRGNFSTCILPTIKLGKDVDYEGFISFSYSQKITDKVQFKATLEEFGNFSKDLNFITSDTRIGLARDGYEGGFSGRVFIDNELNPSFDLGIYLSKTF